MKPSPTRFSISASHSSAAHHPLTSSRLVRLYLISTAPSIELAEHVERHRSTDKLLRFLVVILVALGKLQDGLANVAHFRKA